MRGSRPSYLSPCSSLPPSHVLTHVLPPLPRWAGKGNSAGNPASEQGVEHSAILPDAGGEDSAAPTVKKDGQEVDATECPKPPNQLKDGGKVR
jgi:hypothetical protein